MSFKPVWSELEGGGAPNSFGYVQRRLFPESGIDLFLAVKKPANTRMLVLFVDRSAIRDIPELPAGRGVATRIQRSSSEGREVAVEIALTDPRYSDVFDALVIDVASAAADDLAVPAVEKVLGRLRRWQRFLEAHLEGLGPEGQRGLFAELWFLRNLLLDVVGENVAVGSWTGPAAANQDFQLRGVAVEIKSSIAKQLQSIRITNERQLDGTGIDHLFLFHLSLDARHDSGETLPALVDSLKKQLAGNSPALDRFHESLLQCGYLDEHAPRYQNPGYTPRDWDVFAVTDTFPRVVEDDLPAGVGDIHYSISIAECRRHSVAFDVLKEALHDGR